MGHDEYIHRSRMKASAYSDFSIKTSPVTFGEMPFSCNLNILAEGMARKTARFKNTGCPDRQQRRESACTGTEARRSVLTGNGEESPPVLERKRAGLS